MVQNVTFSDLQRWKPRMVHTNGTMNWGHYFSSWKTETEFTGRIPDFLSGLVGRGVWSLGIKIAFLMPDITLQVYMQLIPVVNGWDVEGLLEQGNRESPNHSRGHTGMVSYLWMAGGDSFGHIQLRVGSDSSAVDVDGSKFWGTGRLGMIAWRKTGSGAQQLEESFWNWHINGGLPGGCSSVRHNKTIFLQSKKLLVKPL